MAWWCFLSRKCWSCDFYLFTADCTQNYLRIVKYNSLRLKVSTHMKPSCFLFLHGSKLVSGQLKTVKLVNIFPFVPCTPSIFPKPCIINKKNHYTIVYFIFSIIFLIIWKSQKKNRLWTNINTSPLHHLFLCNPLF